MRVHIVDVENGWLVTTHEEGPSDPITMGSICDGKRYVYGTVEQLQAGLPELLGKRVSNARGAEYAAFKRSMEEAERQRNA